MLRKWSNRARGQEASPSSGYVFLAAALMVSGCCFGGGGIPANPATPPGYVSGLPYAHCITATTPFNRCTELANTGPESALGRVRPGQERLPPFVLCGSHQADPGECPLEGRVGACLAESGRLYVDYDGGAQARQTWSALERACTATRPTARYVRATGVDLAESL